jgi:hypothetical protein
MQATDLFGQPVSVEAGKGGKPRLVFGESAPPRQGGGPAPPSPPAPSRPSANAPAKRASAPAARPAVTPSPLDALQRARAAALVLRRMHALAEAEAAACEARVAAPAPAPPDIPDELLTRAARTALDQPWLKAQAAFLTNRAARQAGPPAKAADAGEAEAGHDGAAE